MRAGTPRNASRPTSPRTARSPRRRSTGSGTAAAAAFFRRTAPHSQQPGLLGAGDVGGEPLVRLTALEVAAQHPLAVVGRLGLGHLVAPELAAEGCLHAEVAAQVH